MSELMELIKKKRKEQSIHPKKEKIGRLCKYYGDYVHVQSILSREEREKLLFMTGESVQDSLRTAITFYIENKKDD